MFRPSFSKRKSSRRSARCARSSSLRAVRSGRRRPAEAGPTSSGRKQIEMAGAIADALSEGGNLCVEAPTGVGKSFAYLVPLIYRSRSRGRPAIISTETINLQEQLIDKDIPLLRELTGVDFPGRPREGAAQLPPAAAGSPAQRRTAGCTAARALARARPRPDCQMARARRRRQPRFDRFPDGGGDLESGLLRNRQLSRQEVSVFPQLLLLQGAAGVGGVPTSSWRITRSSSPTWRCAAPEETPEQLLPNYGAVLIDEAHTLENNAAEHLGLHLSRAGVIATLNRLYNPDSARGLLIAAGLPARTARRGGGGARRGVRILHAV